jgi:hypothetical protein
VYTNNATNVGAIKLIDRNRCVLVRWNCLDRMRDRTLNNPNAMGAINVYGAYEILFPKK